MTTCKIGFAPTAHVDESITLLADKELTADHLRFEATETIKLLRSGVGATCIGWNDRAAWDAQQQMMGDLKIMNVPMDLDTVVNTSFVANAFQRQGITCP